MNRDRAKKGQTDRQTGKQKEREQERGRWRHTVEQKVRTRIGAVEPRMQEHSGLELRWSDCLSLRNNLLSFALLPRKFPIAVLTFKAKGCF